MSGEIFFRDYRAIDLEDMFRLDEACFGEEFRFDRESMRRFAGSRGAITLLAEGADEQLVGFVIVHVEGPATGKYGYVVTLDVSLEYRRCRVGERLMNEIEGRVRLAGAAWMGLHVFAKNDGAIRFYERQGYQRVETKTDFYGRNLDAWVYRKALLG
jgi:ribosomal protein S18 acetylase RimI-like enzyme